MTYKALVFWGDPSKLLLDHGSFSVEHSSSSLNVSQHCLEVEGQYSQVGEDGVLQCILQYL